MFSLTIRRAMLSTERPVAVGHFDESETPHGNFDVKERFVHNWWHLLCGRREVLNYTHLGLHISPRVLVTSVFHTSRLKLSTLSVFRAPTRVPSTSSSTQSFLTQILHQFPQHDHELPTTTCALHYTSRIVWPVGPAPTYSSDIGAGG